MQDREAQELRQRVARLKRQRTGFRFSATLRAKITSLGRSASRARCVVVCDLSRAIGVPAATRKRWAAPRAFTTPAILPV